MYYSSCAQLTNNDGVEEMTQQIDFATQKLLEAQRRIGILGPQATLAYDYEALRERSRQTGVPLPTLKKWQNSYQSQGHAGLIPTDWPDMIGIPTYTLLQERLAQLDGVAHADTLTPAFINQIAQRNSWSYQRAKKWLHQYQIGGLYGLAPQNTPDRPRRPKKQRADLATLREDDLQEVYHRRELLGRLADRSPVTQREVEERANEVGIAVSTLWNYLRSFRDYGLSGLAPRTRSDRGLRHGISDRMVEVVKGIRLTHRDFSVNAVHKEARERARALGEIEPTKWQVRMICKSIPKSAKLLADGRVDEFRNRQRLTYPIHFEGVVYQIDHTPVDILVKDMRRPGHRKTSGETRPWLTILIDSRSRLVLGTHFSYDRPDRFAVASVIRDALLVSDEKPFGGIPSEIWVDNGKELISQHIAQLTRELSIQLQPCAPHQPQLKGIVERFFGVLNTRLWSTLPGYVGSNTVQRNPQAKAELTLSDLVERFEAFITQYHQEVHREIGLSPITFWNQNCFAEPVDPRKLDILLKEVERRRVTKEGIAYGSRTYWHTALGSLVGTLVLIRVAPSYTAPDEIEVFHDDYWICTAFAIDSKTGQAVTQSLIAAAQREQKETARLQIQAARAALQEVDHEIGERAKPRQVGPSSATSNSHDQPHSVTNRVSGKSTRSPDLLDQLAGIDG